MLDLAMGQGAETWIAHGLDLVQPIAETPADAEELAAPAWETGEPMPGRAADQAPRARIGPHSKLLRGQQVGHRIADEVARRARLRKTDVIVIGIRGRHGVSRVFPGSGANSVARGAIVRMSFVRGK